MGEYLVRAASPLISLTNPNTTSDEEDNNKNSTPNQIDFNPSPLTGAIVVSGDNGGGENLIPTPCSGPSSRKPRGRPPGSKNKPKPPVVITRESESAMRPVLLELASGCDIISSLSAFSLRRSTTLSVLSGTGSVSNVMIRLPEAPSSNIILQGRFDLLSLSGTVLLPTTASSSSSSSSNSTNANTGFAILMCGPQGHVFGGIVAGPLIAADRVMIVASVYSAPEVHHLPFPLEEQEADVAAGVKREMDAGKVKGEGTPPPPPPPPLPLYGGPMMARPEMALWSQAPSSRAAHSQNTPQY